MFGFSTSRERVYMGVGSLSAALAGVTFPFFLMYFGQITAIFSQPATAAEQGFQLMLKFLLIGCVYWVLSTTRSMQLLVRSAAGASPAPPRACASRNSTTRHYWSKK